MRRCEVTTNAKLSHSRRKRKAERKRRARMSVPRRAGRRGGSSSPASGSALFAYHVIPHPRGTTHCSDFSGQIL